jgi:hypothetical protein
VISARITSATKCTTALTIQLGTALNRMNLPEYAPPSSSGASSAAGCACAWAGAA